ncbi:methylamine utilization protein MauJ [Phyllobacterium sp. CCNWLW109]|uniref:methylamine utilization protein MauJ n=1 Tax=Phyllobacterium sp. CCNWLW109 TaxID=3127479 RepID=UPI0030779B66
MYARELMIWLHERLAERGSLDQTRKRFESLRGHNLLPRGRQNAAVRLSNEQIASAVLGFAHPAPGYAGHASLILGNLHTVGGVNASFKSAATLNDTIAVLVGPAGDRSSLQRLTLSVERDFGDDEYVAVLRFRENNETKTVSFVSKYAVSLFQPGAEKGYDHDKLDRLTAIERSLGPNFFRDLSRTVSVSRQLDRPLKTDWREYETEEEKAEFHRRLGAGQSSHFLNLRVDAQVTWPKEPTRMEFGGHHFVLFPKTKEHSHSISIDLARERISADTARTLINRMLSVMSWCDNQPASLHEGWSGNSIPVPVPRQDLALMTMHEWLFYRTLSNDEDLMRCLAYYRDGLNAYSVGLASHAVLSFFRVFETRYDTRKPVTDWVNSVFPSVKPFILESALQAFEADRVQENVDVGTYVYRNCRVATAHAARDVPSDPDGAEESRRLLNASKIMQHLARYFIKQEFKFSSSYLTDEPGREGNNS